MADINSDAGSKTDTTAGGTVPRGRESTSPNPRAVCFIELLFFAYRDFTGEPDDILDTFGFGRAHHRVLHFVHRNPGLRVADLLEILKITKQSLARVLKQLIRDGFIRQQPGEADRRERHLFVTDRGRALALDMLALQSRRINKALAAAGPDAEAAVTAFLLAMVADEDREMVAGLIEQTSYDKREDQI